LAVIWAALLLTLPAPLRKNLGSNMTSLPPLLAQKIRAQNKLERAATAYEWRVWARAKQLPPPGNRSQWLICAGRGFGKTRTGSEFLRFYLERGLCGHAALIGRTAADLRDVLVEGPSGLLAIAPPWARPTYNPSKRRVTWPNGAYVTTYSAEEPDSLRGPQHDIAFGDELAAWPSIDVITNLQFGMRIGAHPRVLYASTPRPTSAFRFVYNDPSTVVVRGTTRENEENLATSFMEQIKARFEGTRLGRQEIEGELLTDLPGALWSPELIDAAHSRAPARASSRIFTTSGAAAVQRPRWTRT
jgi:phage terminase large subunit-like protein